MFSAFRYPRNPLDIEYQPFFKNRNPTNIDPFEYFSTINISDLNKTNFARLVSFQRDRAHSLRLKENLPEIIDAEFAYLQKITQYYYRTFMNIDS